jgi:hypothetical protein
MAAAYANGCRCGGPRATRCSGAAQDGYISVMSSVEEAIEAIAGETGFSGVVRIDAALSHCSGIGDCPERWSLKMVRPRSDVPRQKRRYGLGFWLHASSEVVLVEGYDAGVSFRSMHDPVSGASATVVANTSDGAWPFVDLLERRLTSALP